MSDFYRVAAGGSDNDCKCQACVFWTIVFVEKGEEIEIGQSWQGVLGKNTAEDICDLMNMAFDAGQETVVATERKILAESTSGVGKE